MALPYDGRVTFSISVTDLERAANFYRDTLGLGQVMFSPEFNWAEFDTGVPNCTIGMGASGEQPSASSSINLGVTDVDAARRELESRGVQFDDNIEVPGQVKLAMFKDPDGNGLMLVQRLG